MASTNIASVAFAAFNRFFHHPQSQNPAKMSSQAIPPISPTYSDSGSGFSAPSPSPFSSSSVSTSATSYTDYNRHQLYDFSPSEQPHIVEVDGGIACLYNPDMSDYSGFASAQHPPADSAPVVFTPAGEIDLTSQYTTIMTDFTGSNAQNDCNNYITWSPKTASQNLSDSASNNSYQQVQQQGQHIADVTSTSTSNDNKAMNTGSNSATSTTAPSSSTLQPSASTSNPNGAYAPSGSINLIGSSGPAKPSMLGPLYIPQSQPSSTSSIGGSAVPIHSPIPSRYPESVVSGGQSHDPSSYQRLMPQSHYQHHQRHPSSGSTGSSGGHPVLFDVDLDEWHPHSAPQPHSQHLRYPSGGSASSASPPQMFHQPPFQHQQQPFGRSQAQFQQAMPIRPRSPSRHHGHGLSLNTSQNGVPTGSPASSLSSLSPGQMSLPPLTPGHEFGHGLGADYAMVANVDGSGLGLAMSGPPPTPIIPSPVIPGPSSYPGLTSSAGRNGTSSSHALLNQRRASLGMGQPSTSPNASSLSPTSRHHSHPYAQGYQQRNTHGRPSPLHPYHLMQQARRSPLHQEYYDDVAIGGATKVGSMNPGSIPEDDEYAGQYEKMYRERCRQDMKRQDRYDNVPGSSSALQSLGEQRRHSAPFLEMQLARSQAQQYRGVQHSPVPVLVGEMGRRPSAPASQQLHAQQQGSYGNPNNGGYGPSLSPSPSSATSSRSVPIPPSLSASSSGSSLASRSPIAILHSQSLPTQHSHPALAAVQHDSTRLLSDMMNSGSMTCIPGSVYDEEGIHSVSEGVDLAMNFETEEKGLQQQHNPHPPFEMDLGGMDMMDVDAAGHHGNPVSGEMGMGMDMDTMLRMSMEMSMGNSGLHHTSSGATTAISQATVYVPPMPVTVDMSELTGRHSPVADIQNDGDGNVNPGISPRMMLDEGDGAKGDPSEHDQQQHLFDFDSGLDTERSPTLVGSVAGIGVVQDWQKAGGEYDSADSSDSDSEGEDGLLLSDIEAGNGGFGEKAGKASGRRGAEAGAARSKDAAQRRATTGTAHTAEGSTTTVTVRRTGTAVRPRMKQRASNRTITSIRSTRSKASTQTLTQRDVNPHVEAGAQIDDRFDNALGEEDADGEDDILDEEEAGQDEDEEIFSSSDDDYDDDKDGEFVLRSRSRSNGATVSRSTSKRSNANPSSSGSSASAPVAGRGRTTGGRSLRTRVNANGRYNPYSVYAASVAAASQANDGGEAFASGSGLRTLNVTGLEASEESVSPVDGDDYELDDDSVSVRSRKVRPATNLPVPVPVPNLTKKSRGRRVPTVSSLEELRKAGSSQTNAMPTTSGRKGRGSGGTKGTRMYLCDVEGCGKCFARGEHLKRHVRSIHTNEKPHTCPYPGCGKDFSRHDNLGQHMRVHKDYVPPPNTVKA